MLHVSRVSRVRFCLISCNLLIKINQRDFTDFTVALRDASRISSVTGNFLFNPYNPLDLQMKKISD